MSIVQTIAIDVKSQYFSIAIAIVGTLIALENVPGTFSTFNVGMFSRPDL